jgi:hypothetical protein
MKKLPFILLVFISVSVCSQDRSKFLYAEIADQSFTLYPFYKVFGNNFDPAVILGGGINYRQKEHSAFFQTLQLTGFSTRLIGDGLNLTTSIGYRYCHTSGIFAEGMLGIGASIFYSARKTYSPDEEGNFLPVFPIHGLSSVPADLVLGYGKSRYAFYIKYRYMMQGPYNSTMPALPTSLLGLGLRYNINADNE